MAELIIRRYRSEDLEKLKQIHAKQGFSYAMPEISQFCLGAVIENGHGADTAIFLRKTAETYLLMDPALPVREKMRRLLVLDREIPPLVAQQGIVETYAMIPPEIEAAFQHRLFKLGWRKQLWPMYSRQIKQVGG